MSYCNFIVHSELFPKIFLRLEALILHIELSYRKLTLIVTEKKCCKRFRDGSIFNNVRVVHVENAPQKLRPDRGHLSFNHRMAYRYFRTHHIRAVVWRGLLPFSPTKTRKCCAMHLALHKIAQWARNFENVQAKKLVKSN